jgi:hypothetical protein
LNTILVAERSDLERYRQAGDNEAIKRSQNALRVLDFMLANQDKHFIVDVCDNGESRQPLMLHLNSAKNVPGTCLNFNTAEEARRHFDGLLLEQLRDFSSATDQLTSINTNQIALKAQIEAVQKKTTQYQILSQQTRPSKNETALLPLKASIATLSKENQSARDSKNQCEKTAQQQRQRLSLLDSTTPMSYRTLTPYQNQLNFLRGNDSYYYYNGIPFVRIDFDELRGGEIKIKESNRSAGVYHAKYRRFNGAYDNYYPKVTVYVESRRHPDNVSEIERLRAEIATSDRSISAYSNVIQRTDKSISEKKSYLNTEQKRLDTDYVQKTARYEAELQDCQLVQQKIRREIPQIKEQVSSLNSALKKLESSMQTRAGLLLPLVDIIRTCTFRDLEIKRLFSSLVQTKPLTQIHALTMELDHLATSITSLPCWDQHNKQQASNRHLLYQPLDSKKKVDSKLNTYHRLETQGSYHV